METFFIFLAKYLFILPLIILGLYFFSHVWEAQKQMAFFALPAGLFTYLIGIIANHLYFDPRPFVVNHFTPLIQHIADNGFPSDHTLLVASLASVGMYWNKKLGIILWILALLVATGRIVVGLHHLLDIIASIIIALTMVTLWHKVSDTWYNVLTQKIKNHKELKS